MIDWSKPIETTDGQKARVLYNYLIGGDGRKEVILAISQTGPEGDTYELAVARDWEQPSDIVNVPHPDISGWVNIYRDTHGHLYPTPRVFETLERAQGAASSNTVATLRIEGREGDGLLRQT